MPARNIVRPIRICKARCHTHKRGLVQPLPVASDINICAFTATISTQTIHEDQQITTGLAPILTEQLLMHGDAHECELAVCVQCHTCGMSLQCNSSPQWQSYTLPSGLSILSVAHECVRL